MSTRRARIKSVAAIPVRKKPVAVGNNPKTNTSVKLDIQINPPSNIENATKQETIVDNKNEVANKMVVDNEMGDTSTSLASESTETILEPDMINRCIDNTAEVNKSVRRRTMKPVINLPTQKRKEIPNKKLNSPVPNKKVHLMELIAGFPNSPSPQPIIDLNFQEPFSSPSIVNSEKSKIHGITPLIKPMDKNAKKSIDSSSVMSNPSPLSTECNFDPIIPLPSPSPSKNRFKLKPAPLFSPRRSSIHESLINELDDDVNRSKNRSDEFKSSLINLNIPSTPSSVISNANRNRNDSICSVGIDSSVIVTPRPKKHNTSENTKRSTIRRRILNREPQNPLTMSDLIYYNPPNNAMKSTKSIKKEEKPIIKTVKELKPEEVNDSQNNTDASAIPVPQVKLGPNGEIVIDEQSLVIETTDAVKSRTELSKLSVVYESGLGPGSGGIYRRASRCKDWSHNETLRFYKALNTIGTDFALMLSLFPGRARKDLKVKFKREEKHNLKLINKALLNPLNFDITELEQQLSHDQKAMEQKKVKPQLKVEPKPKKKYKKTNIGLRSIGMEPPEKKPIKTKPTIETQIPKTPSTFTIRSNTPKSTNSNEAQPKKIGTPVSNEGVADVEPGSMIILVNQVPSKPGFNTLQAYIATKSENAEMMPINLEFKMLMSIAKEMNILKPGQKYIPVHHDKNVSNLLSPIHSSSM